jgi:hypothetical protein
METGDLDAVKPNREPDYVASYGSMFWWHEMVYISGLGEGRMKLKYDGDSGVLYAGKKALAPDMAEKYRYWLYGAFEEAILNAGDEDTTTKS